MYSKICMGDVSEKIGLLLGWADDVAPYAAQDMRKIKRSKPLIEGTDNVGDLAYKLQPKFISHNKVRTGGEGT